MRAKIFFAIATIICICSVIYAQTSNAPALKYRYCELVYKDKWDFPTRPTSLTIDYGNGGEDLKGNAIENMNMLGDKGWEMLSTYIIEGDGWTGYYYVFKRRK